MNWFGRAVAYRDRAAASGGPYLISAQVSFEISTGPDTSPLVAASCSSRIRRAPKRQRRPLHP